MGEGDPPVDVIAGIGQVQGRLDTGDAAPHHLAGAILTPGGRGRRRPRQGGPPPQAYQGKNCRPPKFLLVPTRQFRMGLRLTRKS
jgi:hypothetical protein